MQSLKSIFITLTLIFSLSSFCYAQKKAAPEFTMGLSGIYNFQTESYGAGVRGQIKMNNRLFVVPQFSYLMGPVNEFYVGASVQYTVIKIKKIDVYTSGAFLYNKWLNNKEGMSPNNFAPSIGGGIAKNTGCVRPFLEQRYNIKWKEANIRFGLLFNFGECGKNNNGGGYCPAYD